LTLPGIIRRIIKVATHSMPVRNAAASTASTP
jgi:hypothetical protein